MIILNRKQIIKMPKGVQKAIKRQLAVRFSKKRALGKWNEIVILYHQFQNEILDIGGRKNLLWEQMYASLAMFAYYEVLKRKPDMQEMESLAVEALIGNNRILGKFLDFNWRWVQKLYSWMYVVLKKQTDPHIEDGSWHNTWRLAINPERRTEGVNIRLIGCPVFDFAQAHGYENLMPVFCKSDYRVFEPFHCKMIRYHTVANGDGYCDFWQVGDRSQAWKNADKSKLI